MSAATIYFLFALIAGAGESASFQTLGEFQDAKSCTAASAAIAAALSNGTSTAHVFCVSSDDVAPLAKAAHGAD